MEDVAQSKLSETWDRLTLLLIAQPREGWEREFEDIIRREVMRLKFPAAGVERDE